MALTPATCIKEKKNQQILTTRIYCLKEELFLNILHVFKEQYKRLRFTTKNKSEWRNYLVDKLQPCNKRNFFMKR